MFFTGKIEIKINQLDQGTKMYNPEPIYLLSVMDIEIKNDARQLGSDCDISLPLNVRIKNSGQYLIDNVRVLFKSGDKIEVTAWYTQYPYINEKQKVFEGFILDFIEGTPLKMRCTDFIYNLETGEKDIKNYTGKISVLFQKIIEGTGVVLHLNNADATVTNISFKQMSPAACLQYIKKSLFMPLTLLGNKLFWNLSTYTLNTINLNSSTNVIEIKMQKPEGTFQKFKVNAYIKNDNGTLKTDTVGGSDLSGESHNLDITFVNSKDHKKIKDNSLNELKFGNYNGSLTTLLYPAVDLFDAVNYVDKRYPDRSGKYVVRGYILKLGKEGFHRELQLAYLRELQ